MLTSAGTNRHSSVYYVHLHGVVRKSRASKTIGHVLIALPYFHLCAERPSSGNEAKPLWALKMWHLSHVSDIHCSKIFPASSWQRWWILASVWIQLACRSEALGSFFFFSFFFLFLLTAYLCGANKMWHHAAFCSSHSLEANQICVKHDMKWRGGGPKWDNFSRIAAVDFWRGQVPLGVFLRPGWLIHLLSRLTSHPRHILGGCASAVQTVALH